MGSKTIPMAFLIQVRLKISRRMEYFYSTLSLFTQAALAGLCLGASLRPLSRSGHESGGPTAGEAGAVGQNRHGNVHVNFGGNDATSGSNCTVTLNNSSCSPFTLELEPRAIKGRSLRWGQRQCLRQRATNGQGKLLHAHDH